MTSTTRYLFTFVVILMAFGCAGNNATHTIHFTVQNQLSYAVSEAAVQVDLSTLPQPLRDCRYAVFAASESGDIIHNAEIPSQCDDLNGDGTPDAFFFLTDLEASELRHFAFVSVEQMPEYEHRTQAFLNVQIGGRFVDGRYVDGTDREMVYHMDIPNEQVQNSGWAHMEGPVWESDMVGYRAYLDARNRIDIFGKSMPELVLDTITQNYHQIHPWGTDVLVVGRSLGLGSVAAVQNGEVQTIDNWSSRRFDVPVNGPLRSIIRMVYTDWNVFGRTVDVVWEVEIHAGNRYTEQRVALSGNYDGLTMASGIVKHPPARELHSGNVSGSLYAWTSGDQSDQGHRLDMGIVFPERYHPTVLSDAYTHLFAITPIDGNIAYRYTSAWEFDHTEVGDFQQHVRTTGALLTNPPLVRF